MVSPTSTRMRPSGAMETTMTTPIKWGNEFTVNAYTLGDQKLSSVTGLANGRFVVTWTDDSHSLGDTNTGVHGQVFNADGSKFGAEFLVNPANADIQDSSTVAALNDGRFVVAWYSFDGSKSSIHAQVFEADG